MDRCSGELHSLRCSKEVPLITSLLPAAVLYLDKKLRSSYYLSGAGGPRQAGTEELEGFYLTNRCKPG